MLISLLAWINFYFIQLYHPWYYEAMTLNDYISKHTAWKLFTTPFVHTDAIHLWSNLIQYILMMTLVNVDEHFFKLYLVMALSTFFTLVIIKNRTTYFWWIPEVQSFSLVGLSGWLCVLMGYHMVDHWVMIVLVGVECMRYLLPTDTSHPIEMTMHLSRILHGILARHLSGFGWLLLIELAIALFLTKREQREKRTTFFPTLVE